MVVVGWSLLARLFEKTVLNLTGLGRLFVREQGKVAQQLLALDLVPG